MNYKGVLCVFILVLLVAESNIIAADQFTKNSTSLSSNSKINEVEPNLQMPQIEEHKVTVADLTTLKNLEGVSFNNSNSNQVINGNLADANPPTAQEWTTIAPDAYLVTNITPQDTVLPASVDNSKTPWFPPIANQQNGCTAFSVAYYIKTFQEAKEHEWDLSGATWEGYNSTCVGYPTPSYQNMIMSPAFAFTLDDPSGSIESEINLACNIGACTWAKMPYDKNGWTTWPSEQAWIEAPLYRGNSTTGIQYLDVTTISGLNNLKSLLNSQNLASFYIDATALTPTNLTPKDVLTLDNYNSATHNHANTIVGYDDNFSYVENGTTQYGAFKIANSWGAGISNWENIPDGFYWISYAAMQQRFKTCLFFNDMIGYKPDLTASFRIVHDKRSDCSISVGVGSQNNPIAIKSFTSFVSGYPYPYSSNDALPFPDNPIILDITEFERYLPQLNGQTFWLNVYDGGSAMTGIVTSFAINSSKGSQESTNTPCQTINGNHLYVSVNYPAANSLMVSPSLGSGGAEVSLQGSNFTPQGTASLSYLNSINNQWISIANNIAVSSFGNVSYNWVVPDLLQNNIAGDQTQQSDVIIIRGQDVTSGLSYNTTIPYAEMRRGLARVGDSLASGLYGNNTDLSSTVAVTMSKLLIITGCWFQPGSLSVLWDNNLVLNGAVCVDRYGTFNIGVTVPLTTAGKHTIVLQNGNATFTVAVTANSVNLIPASAFAAANGMVYVASPGTIYAFNANSGALQWTNTTNIDVNCVVADSNFLYLGSASGVYAITLSSRATLWSMTSTYYTSACALTITNGALYEATTTGRFQAINPGTGAFLSGDTGSYGSKATATVVSNGIIYMALQDGRLRAYTMPATTYWRQNNYGGVESWTAIAIDNGVLFGSSANHVYAFSVITGNYIWRSDLPIGTASNISSLTAANGQVYVGFGNLIYTLSATDGNIIWSKDTGASVYSVAVASGELYLASGNLVEAVSASGGSLGALQWAYPTSGTVTSLNLSNGLVSAISTDGSIYSIDAASGQELWNYLNLSYSPPTPTPTPSPNPTPNPTATPIPSSTTPAIPKTSTTNIPNPTRTPTAIATPTITTSPTHSAPEFSWLTILPILLCIPIVLFIVRKRLQRKVLL